MKIAIVNTDYAEFLEGLHRDHPSLAQDNYVQQMQVRYASLFGVADFYSRNLRALGHDAFDLYVNNLPLQRAWMRESGRAGGSTSNHKGPGIAGRYILENAESLFARVGRWLRSLPGRLSGDTRESMEILVEQIKHHRPDVLLNQAMDGIESRWLYKVKPWVRLLVGQHAATPLPYDGDYGCYDLIISSFQPTVDFFLRKGVSAVLHRLGFDPSAFALEADPVPTYPVTFVGSLSSIHRSRITWLEGLCEAVPELRMWGPGAHLLSPHSPLRGRHMGVVWGRQMYEVLRRSKITLNHHGDVAPYANNCRLFEATGMGTLLVTDWKANLSELFEVGKEVVAYRSTEECADMIRHYLKDEEGRMGISRAGQARTLRDHTYRRRMQEFVDITDKRLAA